MKPGLYYKESDIKSLRIFFFVFVLFLYFIRYFSNTLLSQLQCPVLIYPAADLTYWLLHLVHLPQLIVSNYAAALLFDFLFFVSIVGSVFTTKKTVFPAMYLVLASLYYFIFNSYAGSHYHVTVAVLFMAIPFCFRKTESFSDAFNFIRIYFLFMLSSAFFWKLFRGSAFNFMHFNNIIKLNTIEHLAFNKGTVLDHLDFFMLNHPTFAFGLYISGVFLQLLFFVGFFTYKYDKYLFIASVMLFTGNYLFFRLNSFELLLFNLAFIKPGQMHVITNKINLAVKKILK